MRMFRFVTPVRPLFAVFGAVALAVGILPVAQVAPVAAATCGVSLVTPGAAVTQNFDTLSNTAGSTTNVLTIPGWFMTETGGGARDNEQYAVDTGGSATGGTLTLIVPLTSTAMIRALVHDPARGVQQPSFW